MLGLRLPGKNIIRKLQVAHSKFTYSYKKLTPVHVIIVNLLENKLYRSLHLEKSQHLQ